MSFSDRLLNIIILFSIFFVLIYCCYVTFHIQDMWDMIIEYQNELDSYRKEQGRLWVSFMDTDNSYRLNKNLKIRMTTGSAFRILEDFTDRYENVKMAGLNYAFFCPAGTKRPPYYVNTRVYSCILLSNDISERWRGRYNEDTDLSIQVLKSGQCTFLFNQFLCGKAASMTMKGGNTAEVYGITKGGSRETREGDKDAGYDNRRSFAESLQTQHPDVVEIAWKWGRWHHNVNYSVFVQKPILKPGLNIPKGPNEYGLKRIQLTEEEHKKSNKGEEDLNGDE